MNKSVYSLVLMDEVVDEIDKLAYLRGTNRSNLINSILADYVSLSTPQDMIDRVFKTLENYFGANEAYKIDQTPSNGTFLVKSAIRYKYNPIIKYYVELYKNTGYRYGCIKAHIRTQNSVLISILRDFYEAFAGIEYEFIDFSKLSDVNFHSFENGKIIRQFVVKQQDGADEQAVGEALSVYIDNLDKSIKTYINCISNGENPEEKLKNMYMRYLKCQKLII